MEQGNNDHELWAAFVGAKYLVEAKTYVGKCPTCLYTKTCNNYYCLHCRVGGLCPMTFRENGAHAHHRWLQVRRLSCKDAVDPKDLSQYLPEDTVKLIKECVLNGSTLCYLRSDVDIDNLSSSSSQPPAKRSKSKSGPHSTLKRCEACKKAITNSQACTTDILLCSVQCLVTLSKRHPERNLLHMKERALDPVDEFPRTTLEKIVEGLAASTPKSRTKAAVEIDNRSESSSFSADERNAADGLLELRTSSVALEETDHADERNAADVLLELRTSSGALEETDHTSESSLTRDHDNAVTVDQNAHSMALVEVSDHPVPPIVDASTAPAESSGGRRSCRQRNAPLRYRYLHHGGTSAATGARTRAERGAAAGSEIPPRHASPTLAAADYSSHPPGNEAELWEILVEVCRRFSDGESGRD